MASDRHGAPPSSCAEMTPEQLETMLAELDVICQQARALTTAIKVQMADQKQQDVQVLGPRHFLRLLRPAR